MSECVGINIIGAGLSGLSAARRLAEAGLACNLISSQPSERAQSVLAEGGINAALNTMGENDTPAEHLVDTMKGGCRLESEAVIEGLTNHAPDIVRDLDRLGVPFNSSKGRLIQRNFGGQAKKRTAYSKSSTGKMLMSALIDEVRRYEASGLVTRYPHHELIGMKTEAGGLASVTVRDAHSGEELVFRGKTILCTGGLNGFFEGLTTGTTQNTGNAAAIAFEAGAELANLEFIQYHPTTVGICNKRMLISEAARGEGGRLYIMRNGSPWYFMEEKYPELGNLMPRDVVSREMTLAAADPECEGSVFLDMTGLSKGVWASRLSDLREEIMDYMKIDPVNEPVPVSPGIHYFMGGIRVDAAHRTSIRGLYAAGEAACRYHGANRLGGNSMLGAIYGGGLAASTVIEDISDAPPETDEILRSNDAQTNADGTQSSERKIETGGIDSSSPAIRSELRDILVYGLGILRDAGRMDEALHRLGRLAEKELSAADRARVLLGEAMLRSAIERRESRGAHTRTDYPQTSEEYRKFSIASHKDGNVTIAFASADEPFAGKEVIGR